MIHGQFTQGTTPKLKFKLSVPIDTLDNVRFSFTQKNKLILVKELDECQVEENTLILPLTQEETYLFDEEKGLIAIRLRFLSTDGEVNVSEEFYLKVENLADKTEMY